MDSKSSAFLYGICLFGSFTFTKCIKYFAPKIIQSYFTINIIYFFNSHSFTHKAILMNLQAYTFEMKKIPSKIFFYE